MWFFEEPCLHILSLLVCLFLPLTKTPFHFHLENCAIKLYLSFHLYYIMRQHTEPETPELVYLDLIHPLSLESSSCKV